jgi:hypothetical protein
MMIATIPSATAISTHGTPEIRGRAGSCNIARAIRDGEGAGPAASSSVLNGASAGSSAGTLSPVRPRSISRRSSAVGADCGPREGSVAYLWPGNGSQKRERSISRFVQHLLGRQPIDSSTVIFATR